MSSLLEEAIVDAKALKEAALKNAETAVLEKYSVEVKDALSTLLEQEDPMGLEEETESADTSFTDEVPYAFQNEELDGPPADELIEIDFDQLKARISEEEAAGDTAGEGDLNDALGMADDIMQEDGPITNDMMDNDAKVDQGEIETTNTGTDDETPEAGLEEDIDLTEEMISDLIEELVLDMTPRPQGWASVNSADNSIEQANNDAMAAANAAHLDEDEEGDEEGDEDMGTVDVVPDTKLQETKISELKESTRGLKALLIESKYQLTRLNLENAKLVYQNKALNSASLNERQKKQIVEAVQSANSVEEARMIYETIQNAVGSTPVQRTRPQTLREAVQRPASILLSSKKNNEATEDPRMGRMLRLAGLNK